MKRLGFVILLVLFSSVGVVSGDVPRHVDPGQYELVEPDPDVLFMLYHNMFEGMILENVTVQEEWLQMIGEVYSVDELAPLLEEYGGQISIQADNLNLTRHHLDLAIAYIGEYNLSAARVSFFDGLGYLEASNETLPVLRNTTHVLGEALQTDPGLLLGDLDRIEGLVGDYRDFAQLLADFMSGEELDVDEIEEIKEGFEGVVDPGILDQIEDYLDDLEGGLDVDELLRVSLSLDVNSSSVWVGGVVRVSGRLSVGGVGLTGRRLVVRVGGESVEVVTGEDGLYMVDIGMPYLYTRRVEVRGFYWPSGADASVYSPATAVRVVDLLYLEPELELLYDGVAYPGGLWNVSGRLVGEGVGLEGFIVNVDGFGKGAALVTGVDGVFNGSMQVPVGQGSGMVNVSVNSMPDGVYSGVSSTAGVSVVSVPLVFTVSESGVLFSGAPVLFTYTVESDGLGLDGCRVEAVYVDGSSVDYSEDGQGVVAVHVPLWSVSGSMDVRLVADPVEPWINSVAVRRSFYVVNSVFTLFLGLGVIGAGVYLRGYYGRRGEDEEIVEPVPYVEPVVVPVVETPSVEVNSFGGLFMLALRVVERLSGVVMVPSDTLREYLGRVLGGLGERVGGLFRELVLRYERWLYDRPGEPELERVEVLVAGLEEEEDEA